MIVFRKTETGRTYSHIECDFPDCATTSPIASELLKESLFQRGWFVAGGKHRCPDHFHDEIEPCGPIERAADGSEGFVR